MKVWEYIKQNINAFRVFFNCIDCGYGYFNYDILVFEADGRHEITYRNDSGGFGIDYVTDTRIGFNGEYDLESDFNDQMLCDTFKTFKRYFDKCRLEKFLRSVITDPEYYVMGPNDFDRILDEMKTLHANKNADYGDSFGKSCDTFGLTAAAVRLSDKFNRFSSLIKNEGQVKDESLEDTLIDMACYAVMTVEWMRRQEDRN